MKIFRKWKYTNFVFHSVIAREEDKKFHSFTFIPFEQELKDTCEGNKMKNNKMVLYMKHKFVC